MKVYDAPWNSSILSANSHDANNEGKKPAMISSGSQTIVLIKDSNLVLEEHKNVEFSGKIQKRCVEIFHMNSKNSGIYGYHL